MRHQRWLDKMETCTRMCSLMRPLKSSPMASAPTVRLTLDEERAGLSALELVRALEEGTPSIAANPTYVQEKRLYLAPCA